MIIALSKEYSVITPVYSRSKDLYMSSGMYSYIKRAMTRMGSTNLAHYEKVFLEILIQTGTLPPEDVLEEAKEMLFEASDSGVKFNPKALAAALV